MLPPEPSSSSDPFDYIAFKLFSFFSDGSSRGIQAGNYRSLESDKDMLSSLDTPPLLKASGVVGKDAKEFP